MEKKKPVVVINELLVSSVVIKVLYWIDTFKSKSRAYHLIIKSQVTMKILEELTKNGFYLPADIVEIKNYFENVLHLKNIK